MPEEPLNHPPPATNHGSRGPGKRPGSRLLLAAALAAAVLAAASIGSRLPDLLAGLLGIESSVLRLALKAAAVAVALPAMFYLVERLFLERTARRKPRQ